MNMRVVQVSLHAHENVTQKRMIMIIEYFLRAGQSLSTFLPSRVFRQLIIYILTVCH